MSVENALFDIMGENGPKFGIFMQVFKDIPVEDYTTAIKNIEHSLSIGPLFNPNAFLSGKAFDNGPKWIKLFEAARALRAVLDEIEERP